MSVFELVSELCLKVFDSEFTKNDWYPDLPKIRRKALKKLRSKCYEILLHKVSIPNSNYEDNWSPAAQIVGHVFTLQQQGLYRDANKMLVCAHKMMDLNLHCNPVVIAVLELLLRLQDSVERQEDYEPILFRYKRPKPYDPSQGPMPYDILHPSAFQPQPWMLHLERLSPSGYFPASGSFPFSSEPGQDLPVLGRFLQPARLDGRGSTVPLYAIPQFPALTEPRGLQIPSISLEKPLIDEGYATPSLKDSCDVSPCGRSPEDLLLAADAVWQAAITYQPPALRTWESLGSRIVQKERPFLSEAGQEAAQHFIEVVRQWPLMRTGRRAVDAPHILSEEQLIRDIGYLLLGVQSHTFPFSEEAFAFSLAPGVCVQDLSPLAMSNYCRELLELGTCARRLQLLTERGVPGHPRTRLMEALREHVNAYLQFHWGAALLMPQGPSLVALQHWAHGLHRKTVAMAQLCGVAPPSDSWEGPRLLPSGMALVSYIYETLSQETRPDVCCILYSALRGVSQVYFRFLEQWIFRGSLFDAWEEFFIQAVGSADLLSSRDRKYWAHVFHIVKAAVPGFLHGLEDDILLCGKTVHLLKLCCPKAALCVALESGHPPVPCCLRGRELRQLSSKCRQFERRVRELERTGSSRDSDSGVETTPTWRRHGPSEAELIERQEAIRQARERHMLRIKLEQEAGRQAVVQKQLQWRAELQQQAKEAQERREEEQRLEREKELQVLEVNRLRQIEDEQRKEDEKQRIIEYYEELSQIATKRKQLADWKLERLNLRDRREEFILNDRREWRAAAAELNLKNIESTATGPPLTIIEEDSDAAKHETPPENHALPLSLPLVTTTGDSDTAGVGIDNATTNQGSPNNNNVDNVIDRGDINENLNGSVLNIRESIFTNAESNLLDTTIEDAALGNVIPLGNRNKNITFENAATVTKPKVRDQEYGICSQQKQDDTKDKETEPKPQRILSAAERNRLKVMEQEFGIIQPRRERPTSVPFKSSIRDNVSNREHLSETQESLRQNFQDTVTQRRTNRWNMLHGGSNMTGIMNQFPVQTVRETAQLQLTEIDAMSLQRRTNRWNMLHGGSNIITGIMNPFPVQTVPETEQLQLTEIDSMSMKDTPSDDGVQVVLQSPASVDAPMSKSESSGSVNHVYKSASGQSSKTSSSYNITSIASSVSFDMGSGKYSLNTPISTDDGSVDTFKTCAGSGGGYSSESGGRHRDLANTSIPYWRSHRLTMDEGDCGAAEDLQSEHSGDEEEDSSDTSDAVDYTDLTSINVALQKSVAIPLHTQLRLANEAVLKYFFQDLNLFCHFLSLRSFFFLMDGEYSRTMTNSLFKKMTTVRQPSHLLNYVVLNGILQMALDTSSSGGEENAKRLSFKVSSTPDHFQLTSTEVLECLSLHYRTEWPLNVLLTKECLLKYNVIFTFLLKVRLVSWRLEQCFQRLKGAAGKDFGHGSRQYHSVQVWRHEMTHFVRSFQNYIMATALQSCWETFEHELNHVQTLDNLYLKHVGYVKNILFRCLLYKKCRPVHNILMNTFNTILKFHAQLEASQWRQRGADQSTLEHPDFRTLSQIHESFQNCTGIVYKLVEKMIQAGYQTHLKELLEMLNANEYYTASASG